MERERLLLALACVDLTSLRGDETEAEAIALARRARDAGAAAVCVERRLVPAALRVGVRVAAVAGDFPAGTAPLALRVAEVEEAVALGAAEVDVPLGNPAQLPALRVAAGAATLKVILETAALDSDRAVRRAADEAIAGGADFVKTSTGKHPAGGASLAAVAVLCDAVAAGDRAVGIKPSGGIRTAEQALAFLALVEERLGAEWLSPARFRLGASSLLDELLGAVG